MKVWKYQLAVTDFQTIKMPRGAMILSVQPQGIEVCLWARVNEHQPNEPRTIFIVGTGHPMPDDVSLDYIGTFQVHHGTLVFHAFEAKP